MELGKSLHSGLKVDVRSSVWNESCRLVDSRTRDSIWNLVFRSIWAKIDNSIQVYGDR